MSSFTFVLTPKRCLYVIIWGKVSTGTEVLFLIRVTYIVCCRVITIITEKCYFFSCQQVATNLSIDLMLNDVILWSRD